MRTLKSDRTTLLNDLYRHFRTHKKAIRARLTDFQSVSPSEYFYELVYCLLTPQSSAAHAEQVVSLLSSAGFHNKNVDPEPFLRRKECYIRFHRTKSRHLLRMKNQFSFIAQKLSVPDLSFELREWLVKNVIGLGYKEASHFLRNIGKNDGLAILDRHILRNLNRLGVVIHRVFGHAIIDRVFKGERRGFAAGGVLVAGVKKILELGDREMNVRVDRHVNDAHTAVLMPGHIPL